MTLYLGDYVEDYATLNTKFPTLNVSEVPTTLAGTPVISVYKANDVAQSTAGVTLTVDFDGVTGLNNVLIDLSADAFYAIGNDYQIVVTTGTVNSVSWVGRVVASFSIENRFDEVDVTALDGDSTAGTNIKNQYDGSTGLAGDNFPSTQQQVGNLSTATGGLSTFVDSVVETTVGAEVNDENSTNALDGTVHSYEDLAGTTEFYYEADITTNGVGQSILWDGYVQSNGDSADVFGWDWVSSSWIQLGNITGANGTTIVTEEFQLTTSMTGTGADVGKVRFRFLSTDATLIATDRILFNYAAIGSEAFILDSGVLQSGTSTSATLATTASATDELYTHAAIIIRQGTGAGQERVISQYAGASRVCIITPPFEVTPDNTAVYEIVPASVHASTMNGGYLNGAIWIDTVNGSSGTLLYVNGTSTRPVNNLVDARTIAETLSIRTFQFLPGSTATLVDTFDDYEFRGRGYSIDFGNQSIIGLRAQNGFFDGITLDATGSLFRECFISSTTFTSGSGNVSIADSSFIGTLTMSGIVTLRLTNCTSAQSVAPVIDYTASGSQTVIISNYSSLLEVRNLGSGGTDIFSLTGFCDLTLASSCVGGTVDICGNVSLTDNSSGVTLIDDSRVTQSTVNTQVDTALSDYDGPTNTEMLASFTTTDALITTVDTNVDSLVVQVGTAGAGLTDLGGMSTGMKAEVNAEADTALADYDGPTNAEMLASFATTDSAISAVDSVVDAILLDTAEIGIAGVGLSNLGGMSASMQAEVNAQVDTALTDYDGPTNAEMLAAHASTDALIAAVDLNVDAVLVDTAEIGVAGAGLTDLGGMSTLMKAEVNAQVDVSLTDYDGPTNTEMLASFTTTDALITTVDANVDAILVDTAEIGLAGAGLTDLGGMSTAMKAEVANEIEGALDDYDSPTNTEMTAAFTEIKGATWATTDTLENIRNEIVVVDGNVDSILVDTAEIGVAGAGLTDLGGMSTAMQAEVNTEVDTGLADYDGPTNTEMLASFTTTDAAIATVDTNVDAVLVDTAQIGLAGAGLTDLGGMSTAMKAEVNAEVDTGLTDYDGPTNAEMLAAHATTDAAIAVVDGNVDSILVDTAQIGVAGVGLTDLGGMSVSMKAEVNAEADTALADYDGPTNTEMNAAFTEIKGLGWTTTDTLQNIRDELVVVDGTADAILIDTSAGGPGPWATGSATVAKQDSIISTLGVAGLGLTDLGGMSTGMKAEVNAEVDTALSDYDGPTNTEMLASFATTDALIVTVDTVVDAILVDTTAGGAGPWTTGAGGDATEAKQDTIISDLATVDTNVDSILVDTTAGGAGPWTTAAITSQDIADALAAASYSFANPPDSSQMQIFRGRDYDDTAHAAPSFNVPGKNTTGATITFVVLDKPDGTTEYLNSTNGSGVGETVTVPLTAAETTSVPAGTHTFYLNVTYTGGEVQLIARGTYISSNN